MRSLCVSSVFTVMRMTLIALVRIVSKTNTQECLRLLEREWLRFWQVVVLRSGRTGERDNLLRGSVVAKGQHQARRRSMRVCSADRQGVTRLSGRIGRSRQENTLTPSSRAWLIIWMLPRGRGYRERTEDVLCTDDVSARTTFASAEEC